MAQTHDKIGMACASACAVHCTATAIFMMAGGSILASQWLDIAHDWLMPIGLLMVVLGIAPALWRHRSVPVALATIAGLALWGLAVLDPSHGAVAVGLEVGGAACLLAGHWMNITAARRVPGRGVACEQGSERAATRIGAG